jgi:two-component system, OmpR family, sensor histidine kinase CpxA
MRVRASLFAKILSWSFLNLAVVGGVLFALFSLQFRLGPDSPLFVGNRLEFVVARLGADLRQAIPSERNAVLERYSATYRVSFLLFDDDGTQTGGTRTTLPGTVAVLLQQEPPPPDRPRPDGRNRDGGGPPPPGQPGGPAPRGGEPPAFGRGGPREPGGGPSRPPIFRQRTTQPARYWAGTRVPIFEPGERRPSLAWLLVASDSVSGHGLFFDVQPWLLVVSAIVLLSVLIWLPFVRGLTTTIGQMTSATERIAGGRFDTRIESHRRDELGRLSAAINQLSERLAGFVGGQRRFLGDISHELNSPLARLDVALGILEERLTEADQPLVVDAQEEVQLMSRLVAELLAFARAGMEGREVRLRKVGLRPLVDTVVAREVAGRCEVEVRVDEGLDVEAEPLLLARALANVIRNAVRYAGHAGPITVAARQEHDRVILAVTDRGPGVPADALPRLFDPFYRIEADRGRATGGTGLGLAIAKTCVDACQGEIAAANLSPAGFEVRMVLRRAV